MSAEIIPFPRDGNGARDALISVMEKQLGGRLKGAELREVATFGADRFLIMLAEAGYVIVPIEEGLK